MAPNPNQVEKSANRINASDVALIEYGRWIGRRLSGMLLGAMLCGAFTPVAGSIAFAKIQDARHDTQVPDNTKLRDSLLIVAFTSASLFGAALLVREKRKLDGEYSPPSSRLG